MHRAIQLFSRWLFLLPFMACMLAAGMICGAVMAADDAPLVFHAVTGASFWPGYEVKWNGTTLIYKIEFYSDEGKGEVVLKTEKITPTPAQWREFRRALDAINVWRWQEAYDNISVRDGGGWGLEVKYADKQAKSGGSNGYPDAEGKMPHNQDGRPSEPYLQLMAAIRKLIVGRRFDANNETDPNLYTVMEWPLPSIDFREAEFKDVMESLRKKGTQLLRKNGGAYKEAEMKFEYRIDAEKPRDRLTYERGGVCYGTAFMEVLGLYGLDYEMLAPDRILIKDRVPEEKSK